MLTRDSYVAVLQKRAADANESSIPANDSAEATTQEFHRIQEDSRQFLHGIFNNAGAVQSQQSAEAKKIWSSAEGTKIVGTPLMKLAYQKMVDEYQTLKTASPMHKELMFASFCDELEKIGGMGMPGGSLPGSNQAMALAARNKMRSAIPKVYDVSSQAKTMGIAPKLPMGSGTTLNK